MVDMKEFGQLVVGIEKPWKLVEAGLDEKLGAVVLRADFGRTTRFPHPDAKGKHPMHDSQKLRWRHLPIGQYKCFIEAPVPRVKLPDGRLARVPPPWQGRLPGYAAAFEENVVKLCSEMSAVVVELQLRVTPKEVAQICKCYADG